MDALNNIQNSFMCFKDLHKCFLTVRFFCSLLSSCLLIIKLLGSSQDEKQRSRLISKRSVPSGGHSTFSFSCWWIFGLFTETNNTAGYIMDVQLWPHVQEFLGENAKRLDDSPEGASVTLSFCVRGEWGPGWVLQAVWGREERKIWFCWPPGSLYTWDCFIHFIVYTCHFQQKHKSLFFKLDNKHFGLFLYSLLCAFYLT